MSKITFIFLGIFVLAQLNTIGQRYEEHGHFRFVYEGMIGTGDELKIDFVDTTQNKTINTFSLAENNPYNQLGYPVMETQKGRGPDYKTYQVDIEKLKNNELPIRLHNINPIIESYSSLLMWTYHSIGIFEDTTLVIRYDLTVGGYDMVFATCATFYILDRYGNIVSVLDNLNRNKLFEFAVSGQRYFVCTYYPSNYGISKNPGYLAYDLQNNKLIDQYEFEGEYSGIGVRGYDCLIRIGLARNNNTEDLIYLDFEKNKKYKKNLHMNLLLSTKEINRDGFIYQRNGKSDTLLFNRDFKVEDIQ